jgi:hypothetical protein
MAERVEEAELEIAGQKIHLRSVALNTLVTIFIAVAVALIGYVLWTHVSQAEKRDAVMADAFKDMVQAQREQNCLISIPEKDREQKADFCKRVTR